MRSPAPRNDARPRAASRVLPAPSATAGRRAFVAAALGTTLIAAGLLVAPEARAADPVEVELMSPDGESVGTATLMELPSGGVHIDAKLSGLPSGTHGFHLHETGACDGADGFKSAGGHLAGSREHGFLVEGGPHPGDMPNIHVPESGDLEIEVVNTAVSMSADGEGALLDADGSALMVHSGADDYESQPSGDAGDRIACAVIGAGS